MVSEEILIFLFSNVRHELNLLNLSAICKNILGNLIPLCLKMSSALYLSLIHLCTEKLKRI
jgi:hypothetical protein